MANTQGLCYSFKTDLLNGIHAFSNSSAAGGKVTDAFKGALYYATATLAPATTTAYTATGEVVGAGYTATGLAVTNATAPANVSGTTHWTPSGNLSWTGLTAVAFDTLLIYNNTVTGKNSVGIFTFSSQTVNAGTFTLTMPTADQVTGLIRLV
jgi:hypothetical protein